MKNIFIALFHVLDYLDQFKAIKENLLRGVGHLYPLRTPTYLRLSQKPQFLVFFFWKPSLITLFSEVFQMPQNIGETKQPVKVDDWADEIYAISET